MKDISLKSKIGVSFSIMALIAVTVITGLINLKDGKTVEVKAVSREMVFSSLISTVGFGNNASERNSTFDLDYSQYEDRGVVTLSRNNLHESVENYNKNQEEAKSKEAEMMVRKENKNKSNGQSKYKLNINIGTSNLPNSINNYNDVIKKWSEIYKLDENIIKAIIAQESSGNEKQASGAAWGLMQIESTVLPEFYSFGKRVFNQNWGPSDRLDAEKNIAFGCYRMKQNLDHYKGDYYKAIQAYNFSHYSLDLLIKAKGDNWVNYRNDIAKYNGHTKRTGNTKYGDPNYIENVMRYYKG